MQLRRLALVLGFLGMLFVNLAHALGLGDITLKSSLNEPLRAEIKLLQVGSLSKGEILVKLASADAFDRVGVERVFFLSDIRFDVDLRGRVIRLSTRKPVTEPYLNFLVEAQWSAGRLLREYTLLMDIPNVAKNRKPRAIATPKAAAQTTRTTRTKTTPKASAAAVARTPVDSYRVKPGDTLWQVAERVRPSNNVTVYQTMMSLQSANPESFLQGNINNLRKGQVLRVPSVSEIQQISHRQAVSSAAKQYQDWKSSKPTPAPLQGSDNKQVSVAKKEAVGNLRLGAGGDEKGTAGAGSAGNTKALAEAKEEADRLKRENQELSDKLKNIEGQASDAQRIINLQNKRIAELTKGESEVVSTDPEVVEDTASTNAESETTESDTPVVDANAEEPVDSELAGTDPAVESADQTDAADTSIDPVVDEAAADDVLAGEATIDKTVIDETVNDTLVVPGDEPSNPYVTDSESGSEDPVVEPAKVEEPKTEGPVTDNKVEEPVEPESFVTKAINWVKGHVALAGGGLAALLLLLFLLFRRGGDKDIEELNFDEDDLFAETEADDLTEIDEDYTENPLDIANDLESGFDSDDLSNYDDDSGGVESETEDVVGEAEIYAGLGQLDKARDLLIREIEVNPENTDARLALMKILTEQNDLDEFDGQYAQMLPFANGIAVDKARKLRQQFDGAAEFDESMYRAEAESSSDSDDVSLENLESLGVNESDESSNGDGELTEAAHTAEDELELDLDLDLSDLDGQDHSSLNDELDINLSDSSVSNAGESIDEGLDLTDEITSFDEDLESSLGDLSSELDQLEDTTPGDITNDILPELNAGSLEDLDLELDDNIAPELNEDMDFSTELDLDLDLSDDIPTSTEAVSEDVTQLTNLAGGDLNSTLDADDLEMDDLERSLTADLDRDSLDDDLNLDLDVPPDSVDMQSLDQEIDAMTSDLDVDDIDLNVEPEEPDVGFTEAIESTVPAGTSLANDDDLSFLNEADEVATKLDLAKAYVEMEDRDGAQDILKEVLEEGSPAQQLEAKKLLDSL